MDKRILWYSQGNEVRKNLLPILEQEGDINCFVERKQELSERLDYEEIHLIIMEVRGEEKELPAVLDLLSQIRKRSYVPIIVISTQEDEHSKLMAFQAGADDYILTTCSPLEMLARIKSQLRRYTQFTNTHSNIDRIYQVGELVIDDQYKKVIVDGRTVKLTPIEYKILKLLIQEQGKVISISQIYEAIWHMEAVGADNTIAVHICHIREKIERNPKEPQYLKVVWGVGYKVG